MSYTSAKIGDMYFGESFPPPGRTDSRRKRLSSAVVEWVEGVGICASSPLVYKGVCSGSARLAKCDLFKHLEKLGKSPLIDAFAVDGIPKHTHRALDIFHDPLRGPLLYAKEQGVARTLREWLPHMMHDSVTKMSLPLPGTAKAGRDSWRYRKYAAKLVNMRTTVLTPLLIVTFTELVVRTDLQRRLLGGEEPDLSMNDRLARAHFRMAVVSGVFGAAVVAFWESALAYVLLGTSGLSLGMAAIYFVVQHRAGLLDAGAAVLLRGKAMTSNVLEGRPSPTESDSSRAEQVTSPSQPSRLSSLRLGLAAAALVGVLLFTSPAGGTAPA